MVADSRAWVAVQNDINSNGWGGRGLTVIADLLAWRRGISSDRGIAHFHLVR